MTSIRELSIEEIDCVSGATSYGQCVAVSTASGAVVGGLSGGGAGFLAGAAIGFTLGMFFCQ